MMPMWPADTQKPAQPGDALQSTATPTRPDPSADGGHASGSIPTLSLPKGGGGIKGIGEKFTANPVTGTGAMSVPIAVSPGRSGFGPQLPLAYDSGAGNGPFGFGWTLALPSIARKTDKGLPQYRDAEESDVYVLSGSEDLVPALRPDGGRFEDGATHPGYTVHRYRPRIEGLFARIERWTDRNTGGIHWRSLSRDNVTTLYGRTDNSRIADPGDPTRVFTWLICESYDDKGNALVYEYAAEDAAGINPGEANERNRVRTANRYLKRVRYGNRTPNRDADGRPTDPTLLPEGDWLFEAVFDYDEAHYEELAPAGPEAEPPRFVRASVSPVRPWAARPDAFSSYRAGFEVRTYRRCRRVLMFHRFAELGAEPCLVRSTAFEYADLDYSHLFPVESELAHPGSTRFASFLRAVTQSGYVRDDAPPVLGQDGAPAVTYLKKSLPPLKFDYSRAVIQEDVREMDAGSLENLPVGLDGAAYRWVDLDGEGVSGILTEQADGWFYKPSLGEGRFGPMQIVPSKPSMAALNGGRQQLLDLDGDGRLDLVAFAGPAPGFYERTQARRLQEQTWEPFRPFGRLPNVNWEEPNLRFVDLDGDGHADVLITEQDAFTWYPSLAEEGFGPARQVRQPWDEEQGPRLILADGTQSIYLADMCGDGLTDLVRLRNGEVCYWPNLGYGRFGAKVTMDNAPWLDRPDQFSQRRIRLADIDGSGTTDIVYLGGDGVRLYFNQSGNRWSGPRRLSRFPRVDDLSSVTAADLLGNGTACLVWSSPLPGAARRPMRYVDLMGGRKPHLMVSSVNNLGAETRVQYAASTEFYLADKAAGTPWITRIPFPVHVIERVETLDRVSGNRFVTRYAYHHGYFDGAEREFRGFGLVEQWDTEEIGGVPADEESSTATNPDASLSLPPICTKTWFHTGAYLEAGRISHQLAFEYYSAPKQTDATFEQEWAAFEATLLPDTVLPPDLTPAEAREACRALKGSLLRQEVYGRDGTDKEQHPYTVAEQNVTVQRVQPQAGNRHAVFFTHAREALSGHYERSPDDPRIGHTMTVEVDEYGNVLKSFSIGYGRKQSPLSEPSDRDTQTGTRITYTENRVTNAVDDAAHPDDYRTPQPCETRTYEVTGPALPVGRRRFTLDDMQNAGSGATPIDYEQAATPGVLQKRIIEQARTLYRRDDLAGALPLGALQSLALPFEGYKLAFTPGLVSGVYGGRVSDAVLESEGRYVHNEGDANWWVPSGRLFYSAGGADTPAQELAEARAHFFLPRRAHDPFHTGAVSTETVVSYDAYDLLAVEIRDALGNRVTVGERNVAGALVTPGNDYRVLQPRLLMDPNRNRSAVAFDALGMVAGTAVMGKPEDMPIPGDRLTPAFRSDLTQAEIAQFLADPKGPMAATLLGQASTRIVYDLTAYVRASDAPRKPPAWAATIARETHAGDPTPADGLKIQVGFSYSDGFGREIQKKVQAEPGPVPARDAQGGIIVGPYGLPQMTPGDVSPRWVGSGWTVFNNKGKPVRQYEPFFTDTHRFEFDIRNGVSPVLFYDPAGRVVATLHPDHTWEKAVFDPWMQATWDASDTALVADPKGDPDVGDFFHRLPDADYLPTWDAQRQGGALGPLEQDAARKAAVHAGTPSVAHFDALGRAFLTVAHNKFKRTDTPPADPPAEEFSSARVLLDIEGNQRAVVDGLDRVVMRYDYDLLGSRLHQASMEAGERWTLNDVAGKPLYGWDSRDHRFHTAYDPLRRPTEATLREGVGPELVVERTVYGETQPAPEAANLRGKIAQAFDQAGVVTSASYDFKGNLLGSRRQLAADYKNTLDWSAPVALEAETFASSTQYDALNRPTQLTEPDKTVLRHTYNDAGRLERVEANLHGAGTATPFVTNIDYDAKGRRTRIDYGNGVHTTYDYDPRTFRLVHLLTRRNAVTFSDDCPQPPPTDWPGCQVQNLSYTYDPAGNITHIRDDAQQTVYFRNKRVEPSADYTYDALSRLIEATGREHLGQTSGVPAPYSENDSFRVGLPHPGDGSAMGTYIERYVYDAVGNILSMQHRGSDPALAGWTRPYAYNEPSLLEPGKTSNRLTSTGTDASVLYTYDAHGSMTRMPHLPLMQWDYRDQLQATAQQVVNNGGTPETTWYVYDATGQRVRKVTERQAAAGQTPARRKERLYLGGFEVYREYAGNGSTMTLERETLHMMDDKQRIALVEMRTVDTAGNDPASPQLIRYQFGNHLGSASLEMDDHAQIISYEEYTPYGSTSYQAVRSQTETPKRYRYTSKERDEESGLYYHGARYYAPWLGRWTSCDPVSASMQHIDTASSAKSNDLGHNRLLKASDDENLTSSYVFVEDNPCIFVDPDGRSAQLIIEGDTMTIHTNIFIYGKSASETLAKAMQTDIERKWGRNSAGEAWSYKDPKTAKTYIVRFDVRVQLLDKANPQKSLSIFEKLFRDLGGVGSNYVEIVDKNANQRAQATFDTPLTRKGLGTLYVMDIKHSPLTWPHELGHLLGLPDQYKDIGEHNASGETVSTPDPGWEKNVMADSENGIVEQRNINAVIEKLQSDRDTLSDKRPMRSVTPEEEKDTGFMIRRDFRHFVDSPPHPPKLLMPR